METTHHAPSHVFNRSSILMKIRQMTADDRIEVAELICLSTNVWYQVQGSGPIFPGPEATDVYYQVYEAMDPGHGIVATDDTTGRMMGSCFIHPRSTHVSLGIMNVHPNYFGRGVARELLQHIVDFAEKQKKPLRLVSSAMNLDSFSLYSKAGFVPQILFQDMIVRVPEEGLDKKVNHLDAVREATIEDVHPMVELEKELTGLDRTKDFTYFIDNVAGFWHTSVFETPAGKLDGFMVSSAHPGCNMIGPGTIRSVDVAIALIYTELDRHRGRSPVMLVPVQYPDLVQTLYAWGAKNCEMHIAQCRGEFPKVQGIFMPTFLPETA